MWPSVSGNPKSWSCQHASFSRLPRRQSSDFLRGAGDGFSCEAMKSAMRARKGSTSPIIFRSRRSLHSLSSNSTLFPIEAI